MKSVIAFLFMFTSIILLASCNSAPTVSSPTDTSTGVDIRTLAEGGSSQDTLSIKADEAETAYVFESFTAEGGSSRDTIYLKAATRAKFYKIKDFRRKRKP